MEKLEKISSLLVKAIKENDKEALDNQVEDFIEFLLSNYTNPNFQDLTEEDLKRLELCCLALEYERFHLNLETDLIFALDHICKDHPELELFRKRITCIRYPDKISNIENDWKEALELAINDLFLLKSNSISQLSDTGREVFLDRSGIKIMAQVSLMLERLNLHGQLPTHLTTLLLSSNTDNELVRRVLQWTTQQNDSEVRLTEELINI